MYNPDKITRFLIYKGCDPSLAEDIAQDTYVAIRQHNPERECPAYYQRVALNLLTSHYRKKRPLLTDELDALPASVPERECDPRIEKMMGCFSQLAPISQEALRAHYWEGLSRSQAAARFGITEHGWKNRLQRAKAQLEHLMQPVET